MMSSHKPNISYRLQKYYFKIKHLQETLYYGW